MTYLYRIFYIFANIIALFASNIHIMLMFFSLAKIGRFFY